MLLLPGLALAAETTPDPHPPSFGKMVTATLAIGAPPLKEGDWLEWRLTAPADPLEARLADEAEAKGRDRAVPASTPSRPATPAAPVTELPKRWQTGSYRLEVASVTEDGPVLGIRLLSGVAVIGAYPARVKGLLSPLMRRQPEDEEITVGSAVLSLNGAPLTVRTERWATAPGVEWERWTSETVPGGLVRMAGPNADLVLVGWGNGEEPAFPLDAPTPPTLDVVGK